MRYKIFSNDDDTMYVKSLNPLVLASEFEAQIFSRKEIDRLCRTPEQMWCFPG